MVKYSPQEMFRYPEVQKKQRGSIIGNAKKNQCTPLRIKINNYKRDMEESEIGSWKVGKL
jgi:hypothetical protein